MSDAARRLADLEMVFDALAHASRRQILLTIHYWGGAMTAGDIARRFEASWPTITRHLNVLTAAGLVVQARVGRTRRYELVPDRLGVVSEWVSRFDGAAAPVSTPKPHTIRARRTRSA